MPCEADPMLLPGAAAAITNAYVTYPAHYDEVLHQVHARVVAHGAATKLDLAALIAWKRVQTAKWMKSLLELPDAAIRRITSEAFAVGLTDAERIRALRQLPGFGGGGAFTSVLLTAWDPSQFGVYDRFVTDKRTRAVSATCRCDWLDLVTYWEHLRQLSSEMPGGSATWSPRMVEMAIFNL